MHTLIVKKSATVLFLLFFLLTSTSSIGQTENNPSKFTPNIIPPSPTAYALGTYGNTPVGLFTGSQNINIPLYTYKTTNLEVPITMLYSSNGVKVDEISSNVGQSWNLSFGGVISRVIRDKPDEERGSYPIPMSMPESIDRYSPQALSFYQYIGENDVDTEADIYSFNFGKYSGKFVFDNDGGIMMMPAQEFQIQCVASEDIFNFVVTTPDGVKYYFNDREVTTQRIVGGGHNIPSISTSAWYLSRIVHPKGDEIQFTYDNETTSYTASRSQNYRMLYPRVQYDAAGNLENYSAQLSPQYDHTIALAGKAIKSIKSTNTFFGEVSFVYSGTSSADVTSGNKKITQIAIKNKEAAVVEKIDFTYTTTAKKRVFLDKIQFKDLNQNYQFEYERRDYLPERLSTSQDHWGYFNNVTNVNIVPKNIVGYELENASYNGADREPKPTAVTGMLSKITYPTKGYTIFEYGNNSYYGEKKVYPPLSYDGMGVSNTGEVRSGSTSRTIQNITSDQEVKIVGGISYNCGVDDAEKSKAEYTVRDVTDNKLVELYRRLDSGSAAATGTFVVMEPGDAPATRTQYFKATAGHTYIISLNVLWLCTSATLTFSYYAGQITTEPANVITGGVRVSKTLDYSADGARPVAKVYYYAKKNALGISTGNKGQTPYYIDLVKEEKFTESPSAGIYGVLSSISYLNLSSNSLVSLFDTGNSNVFYSHVTVSHGDDNFINGGEEHEFIVHRDGGGGFIVGTYDIRSTPLTNWGWDNGLLKKVTFFNKDKKNVKETINEYEERTEFRKESISYSSRKNYEMRLSADVNYVCTAADLTKQTEYRTCITAHKHMPGGSLINNLSGGVKTDHDCIASGHNNVTVYIKHPCNNGKPLPQTISNLANINNLSIVSYKNIAFWHYLKSTQDIIYDLNGLNPVSTTTNYSYRGINHIQLSSQTTRNSKDEIMETKYFYAKDSEMAGKPFVSELTANNMIETPLDTQTYRSGTKLSEQLTVYDKSASTSNLLLPQAVYAAKFPNDLPNVANIGSLEKKVKFEQYDDKGNIQQYRLENGSPVSIIWGYGKTQPIAKIENATIGQVSGYVSNLQTKSDAGTEADLLTNLNSLRNALPDDMVSTYTYKPLIGISTLTDPKGNTTTYSYDDFNRLKTVKDAQGNIVSENQYHFKK